jgi:hypothetical protein
MLPPTKTGFLWKKEDCMAAKTTHHQPHLHSLEATLIGAFALGILFVLCWITAAYGNIEVPRAFVLIFTNQPVASIAAFYQGLLWALIFGALAGALIAFGSYLFQRRPR